MAKKKIKAKKKAVGKKKVTNKKKVVARAKPARSKAKSAKKQALKKRFVRRETSSGSERSSLGSGILSAESRPKRRGLGEEAAGQSGDLQGLSRVEDSNSESVEELLGGRAGLRGRSNQRRRKCARPGRGRNSHARTPGRRILSRRPGRTVIAIRSLGCATWARNYLRPRGCGKHLLSVIHLGAKRGALEVRRVSIPSIEGFRCSQTDCSRRIGAGYNFWIVRRLGQGERRVVRGASQEVIRFQIRAIKN